MFSNITRINSEGNSIKVNSIGIQQEKCFGLSWGSKKIFFDNSITATSINNDQYLLIIESTSPETLIVLKPDSSELFSLHPPKLNGKYLNFLYPQIHKIDRKLVGLVFTDGKIDYKTSFSLENPSYDKLIEVPK
ncbi:hypothetical protein [Bacterioplanoides pacificum]|uniref:Uncharacterized protein n=1 Tax=Bacterioplanoides pacificum TaxID=1171596 RepID=A0ABV7VS13_9GAMM